MKKALIIGGPYNGEFYERITSERDLWLPDPNTGVDHQYRYCQFGKQVEGNRVLYDTYIHNSMNISSIGADYVINKFMEENKND